VGKVDIFLFSSWLNLKYEWGRENMSPNVEDD
jgi:hypothetical protein